MAPAEPRIGVGLYWHTLKYLRPIQFYGKFKEGLPTFGALRRSACALRGQNGPWVLPIERRTTFTAPTTFRFLNEEVRFGGRIDWNDSARDKLWLYNLHYFDDLLARNAGGRRDSHRALIDDWIRRNPPTIGNGWEPYPTSRRIVNWIKWALAGNQFEADGLASLADQARALANRIEWRLLGNHLIANAKALVFAGCFFDGEEAEQWRRKGLEILSREISEQILPDGGHFERSPMYHAIVLEDLLDLINLARAYPDTIVTSVNKACADAVGRMRTWLSAMCHTDGEIAFFNDAALGVAPAVADLNAYAGRLGLPAAESPALPVHALRHSGYIRIVQDDMLALLDAAPVGPDYQPGHGHADTLSFELSLRGQRVFVNAGISQYGSGAERHRQRSTAAHNTVEVDGENSSEVWSGFRVARRARPFDLWIDRTDKTVIVSCAHDGYRHLRGRVVHRRRWTFRESFICITDNIEGEFACAVARFHLHPTTSVNARGDHGEIVLAGGHRLNWRIEGANVNVSESRFHPSFGISCPNLCIEATASRPEFVTTFSW